MLIRVLAERASRMFAIFLAGSRRGLMLAG